MWAITPEAFVSLAEKGTPSFPIVARARDLQSIQVFCAYAGISTDSIADDGGTDYAYRVLCTKYEAAKFVMEAVGNIDYSNFKDEAHERRPEPEWSKFLMAVWTAGLNLTPKSMRKSWQ